MFGLTQYIGNGALMATTGFMLAPMASTLNRVGYSVSRDDDMPSIASAQPSSEWSAWLTSGYVGDFLGWTGKKLAEVGQNLFPELSIPERQRRMEISRKELEQLMIASLSDEDKEIDTKIREALRIYLKQGVALINRGALESEKWKEELLILEVLSNRVGKNEIGKVLTESAHYAVPLLTLYPNPFELSDLSGSNGFQVNGITASDQSGYYVSGAGDVNGDGYADVIIGAWAAAPNGRIAAGETYVVFGAPYLTNPVELANLNGKNGFQINGIANNDRSGKTVSGAGDVNGDGYDDVIIGASYASPDGHIAAGESYVVFGGPNFITPFELSSLNGNNGFQIKGMKAYEYSGYSVSGVGDVNKDGYDDVIIGVPDSTPSGPNFRELAGESYVIFGGPHFTTPMQLSNLNGVNGFQINGITSYDVSGWSVGGAGDVNGDGYDDIIIGARGADPNGLDSGESYVVFGRSSFTTPFELSSLNGANGFQINGIASDDQAGWSVGGAGDVNRDGYDDVIIGMFYNVWGGPTHIGESYVVFGGINFKTPIELSNLNGINGFQINGITGNDYAGTSIDGAGDVNGDGYADIIVGAWAAAPNSHENAGESYVIFGRANFTTPVELSNLNGINGFQIDGIATLDQSGHSVSGAGDVNRDGYDDVLIGALGGSPNGRHWAGESYVIFGSIGMVIPSPSPAPTPSNTLFYPSTFNTNQLNGKQGFTILGVNAGDTMGWSVSNAGDINNDGISDMIIGAKSTTVAYVPDCGIAYVVFGQQKQFTSPTISISKLTGKNGFSIVGLPRNMELGYAVSYAGDVNKDGIADVMIGAPYSSVRSYDDQAGTAYVLFGSHSIFPAIYNLSALSGSNGFSVKGEVAGDLLGYSVSTAGDVNGDGIADVLIGAPQATADGEIQSGKVYVIFGQRGNFPAVVNVTALGQIQPGFTVYGETEFDKAGQSVAAAGDINADGIADFVIGAPEALVGSNLSTAGKAYVIFGNHNGFPQTLNVTALNGQNGFSVNGASSFDNLGAAVNSAGDVNGDGIADLLIGAPHATVGTSASITGAAYVIFGHVGNFAATITPTSLNEDNGCTLIGYASGDQTGASVAGIGDFNVDGVDDILIGAPKATANGQGRAGKSYLFFGHRGNYPATINLASLDGNTGMTIEGGSTGDEAGFSVSGAGDINADGAPDLLLGAPGLDNNSAGKSHVLLGGISFFSAKPLPRMLNDNGNRERKSIPHKMN